jgi:hypothetical protein
MDPNGGGGFWNRFWLILNKNLIKEQTQKERRLQSLIFMVC